jgi:hypothetical protein
MEASSKAQPFLIRMRYKINPGSARLEIAALASCFLSSRRLRTG